MEDRSHPQYMWGAGISEIDGKYLELYVSRDTSRVRSVRTSEFICGIERLLLDMSEKSFVGG